MCFRGLGCATIGRVTRYRQFEPHDDLPADYPNALGEFLGSAAHNFRVIVSPGDATVLQVVAGPDNNQVAVAVNGRWRYNTSTVSRASPGGAARSLDVHVTASDNLFAAGDGYEIDNTDYSFALALVETGAVPAGVVLSRKVGTAAWDGAQFTSVAGLGIPNVMGPLVVPGLLTAAGGFADSLVSVLPSSPTDGQVCRLLVDPDAGVVWTLRYRASAAAWMFVGGSPLYVDIGDGTASTGVSTPAFTYEAVGEAITIPAAGTYDVSLMATVYAQSDPIYAIYVAAVGSDESSNSPYPISLSVFQADANGSLAIRQRRTLGAGSSLQPSVAVDTAGKASLIRNVSLSVTPVMIS